MWGLALLIFMIVACFGADSTCQYDGEHPLSNCDACLKWCASSEKPACACTSTTCDVVVTTSVPVYTVDPQTNYTRCSIDSEIPRGSVICMCRQVPEVTYIGKESMACTMDTRLATETWSSACGTNNGCAAPDPAPVEGRRRQ